MGIPNDYVCDGQLNLWDMVYQNESKSVEYGDAGCRACTWKGEKDCNWKNSNLMGSEYPNCPFLPCEFKVPRMCANCTYGNQFVHEGSSKNPLETPNIYCTHPDGPLNRHSAYEDRKQKGFGVGTWHRQHEFDTCDRWEEESGYLG